jgi:uncharacterized protein (TIGR01777 family)
VGTGDGGGGSGRNPRGYLRIGIVLSTRGGALSRLLPAFRWGLGGRLGSGRQWWPWIHIEDLAAAAVFCLETERLHGPVNASAPEIVRMGELARTLGQVMGRPSALPVPAFALRLLFGEMAETLILGGARMSPAKLLAARFPYRFPELEPALRDLLSRRI